MEYINEHELTLMLSIGRNSRNFGEPVRELTTEAREIFDESYKQYKHYMKETKGDKRSVNVQKHFKKALEVSENVEPTDEEIAKVYELLVLLARRCLRTFGRNSHLSEDELGSLAFERWVRYRENFDPKKRSTISGARVNSFAYMTQVIKNIIYGEFHKANKEQSIETIPVDISLNIEVDNTIQELEECRDMLVKESLKCSDFDNCLRSIARKYDIDPDIIIKTIMFYDLRPVIEENIWHNLWDF